MNIQRYEASSQAGEDCMGQTRSRHVMNPSGLIVGTWCKSEDVAALEDKLTALQRYKDTVEKAVKDERGFVALTEDGMPTCSFYGSHYSYEGDDLAEALEAAMADEAEDAAEEEVET